MVMQAPPDGYTLLFTSNSAHVISPLLRSPQPFEPMRVVGPDVRREGQPAVGGRRVDRMQVAADPLHHLVAGGVRQRQRGVDQPAGTDRQQVGPQVEPRAGPDLVEAYGTAAGPPRDVLQAAEQRTGATDLVGLGRLGQPGTEGG